MHSDDLPERWRKAQRAMATKSLALGLRLVKAHKGDLLYSKKLLAEGGQLLIVSVHLPGVLRVCDGRTGLVLAESAPGNMQALAPDFEFDHPKPD